MAQNDCLLRKEQCVLFNIINVSDFWLYVADALFTIPPVHDQCGQYSQCGRSMVYTDQF